MKRKKEIKEDLENKELTKLIDKAEKEAKKFVRANNQVEKHLQVFSLSLTQ